MKLIPALALLLVLALVALALSLSNGPAGAQRLKIEECPDGPDRFRCLAGPCFEAPDRLLCEAEGGDVKAQALVGMFALIDARATCDFREAEKWLRLAAEGGIENARPALELIPFLRKLDCKKQASGWP